MRGHTTQVDIDALQLNLRKFVIVGMSRRDIVDLMTSTKYGYAINTVKKHYSIVFADVQEIQKVQNKLKLIMELVADDKQG